MLFPWITPKNLSKLILQGCCLFSVIYYGAGHYPIQTINEAPNIAWDAHIRWLPWTALIYLSQGLFLLLGVIYAPNCLTATRTYYGYLIATLIAGCVFIMYPTQLPRIDLTSSQLQPLISYSYQFIYWSDVPNNCFPSLHTTLALLAGASLRKRGRGWQIVAPLWCSGIIISTLTTKQHCILDVVAGMLLFIFCTWICHSLFNKRQNGTAAFNHSANSASHIR